MTLDALAQQVLLDLGVTNSQEINAGLVRIALAQAERMGMERAAKMFEETNIAAAIRAEMEKIK